MIKTMVRLFLAVMILIASFSLAPASPRIKVIKLSVTNPTGNVRSAENVVVNVADLRRIAPDFKPAAVIITTSDAATITSVADCRLPIGVWHRLESSFFPNAL